MITLVNTTQDSRESVFFQPVLKAYPTCHSWMTKAHVSLRNMEKQWKLFTKQMIRTHQLLPSLLWKTAAPTQLLSGLNEEFSNLNSIYTSYQPLIQAATQLLQREPSFDGIPVSSKCMKKESSTLLRGCAKMSHWHSHYKGCQQYQVKDQPTDLHTTAPASNPCLCDINTQCHQICHPSKQTTYQQF